MRLHGGAVLGKDVGQAVRMGWCRTLPVRRGDGRGDDDGGDGGASYARKTTRLTGGAGLPVRGSARARGLAGGAGLSARESEGSARAASRASEPANGPRGGGGMRGRGGGGRRPRHGPESTQQGEEKLFLFSFLFLTTHFHFCFFSFWTNHLVDNLGVGK
jgi:hypothetical protein